MNNKNWEYRIVRKESMDLGGSYEWYSIQEVYFGEDGKPISQTIDLQIEGDTITEMRTQLEKMINCLGQPVLDEIETSLVNDDYEGPQYLNRKWIYESPDGGKTIYRREEGNYDRKKEKIKSL